MTACVAMRQEAHSFWTFPWHVAACFRWLFVVFYDIRHDKVSSGATHLSAATGAATANNRQGARQCTPLGLRQSFYERSAARHLRRFIAMWTFFQYSVLLRLRCFAKKCVYFLEQRQVQQPCVCIKFALNCYFISFIVFVFVLPIVHPNV